MASTCTARPVSLIQPSSSSRPTSSSVDHLAPLRSLSPPGSGHYSLRRLSHISELPPEEDLVLARSHSILRSTSFSSMGFGFKEKIREKENSRPGKMVDHGNPASSGSKTVPPSTVRFKERPTSSHGLFTLHKSKGLKKKRSLASLLSEPASAEADQAPPRASRTHSSEAASSSHLVLPPSSSLSAAKEKALRAAEQNLRKEEYRQLQLHGPKPKPLVISGKKNMWAKRHNMKVYRNNQATYMQAYDPILLENDRHMDLLLRHLNPLENPSFHDYGRKVPFYVLDVGCGSGHWLLEAVNCWRSSITGFDMVDILIPEARNHDNISFVRGNFLRSAWPFTEKSFDLVRMANLSLCIPYDKWEMVLAEVHRILTIDGRLELIDDQIFFPYAPQPMTRPTSISLPTIKPPVLIRGISFFDMDNNEGADEDGDTDSMNTTSTLIDDGDSSPLHETRKRSSISQLDAHSSMERPLRTTPASLAFDDPNTPTLAATVKPADTARPSEWSLDATACRDMETVFQNMLNKKYRVHSRPSEFIVNVMQTVFGNGEKLKSYHLKLAPKDAATEYGPSSGNVSATGSMEDGDKEESSAESKTVGHRINEITKPWFTADADKEEKKRLKKLNKSLTLTTDVSFPQPDTRVPEGLSAKAADRLGIRDEIPKVVSRIPENVSAKAAHRLGIPMTAESKRQASSRSPSPAPEALAEKLAAPSFAPSPAPIASVVSPPVSERTSQHSSVGSPTESRLSAKAAHRLGISYSALTEAAASVKASSRRPQSSSSTLVSNPLAPYQSPGLIVSPSRCSSSKSTFIPLSPTELEMHACKYVHTLIGCKPALAEYIASFLDEDGNRIESDEDFDQAIWDYECFRRRRFNWPSEIPDSWDTDPDTDAPEAAPTFKSVDRPKSATFRNSMISDAAWASPIDVSEPSSAQPYKHEELTHVRTVRVYEATKTGEYSLSTLQFPRSPPPSPPR